jgi:hypothetical protein
MATGPLNTVASKDSYELYKELSDELMTPIESNIDAAVRYELYLSKLIYLENLQQQCFLSVNGCQTGSSRTFQENDMEQIKKAIGCTHRFMRETILEALEKRLNCGTAQGQTA